MQVTFIATKIRFKCLLPVNFLFYKQVFISIRFINCLHSTKCNVYNVILKKYDWLVLLVTACFIFFGVRSISILINQ